MTKYDSFSSKDNIQKSTGITKKLFRSIAISYIVSFIILIILSLVVTYTSISDSIINPVVSGTKILGIILSAVIFSMNTSSRGWLHGLISGILYVAIIFVTGVLSLDNYISDASVIKLFAYGAIFGITGGIIGINIGKRK